MGEGQLPKFTNQPLSVKRGTYKYDFLDLVYVFDIL
jgi:hypothetical protein